VLLNRVNQVFSCSEYVEQNIFTSGVLFMNVFHTYDTTSVDD